MFMGCPNSQILKIKIEEKMKIDKAKEQLRKINYLKKKKRVQQEQEMTI